MAYHDDEWGRPVRNDERLFEKISLEAFQSGLAWITILRKRENFRAAFAGFHPETVAEFGEADIERLLADTGIVRNRQKIEATIHNARVLAELPVPLSDLLWSFAPPPRAARVASLADIPAVTAESKAMAKDLKKRGFRFVGPTTAYALMQAMGMVDDHVMGCHVAVM
jgi:DNA-3-methyladenine glycosylase I